MHQGLPEQNATHQVSQADMEQRMLKMERQFRQFRKLVFHSVGGFLAGIVLFFTTSYLMAAAPPIVYSGYLEESGSAVSGNRQTELSLWTDATSTDIANHRKCLQAVTSQQFVNGRFKIQLDTACTSATHENANLWVQLKIWDKSGVGKDLARTQLGTVPHAIHTTIQFGNKSLRINALYVGITNKGYKGAEVQGWAGAKAKCEAQYGPTAHMCTGEAILRSLQLGALTDSHFVKSNTNPRHFWIASSGFDAHFNPNGKSYSDGSCYGWTSSGSTTTGNYVELNGGIHFQQSTCDVGRVIACCR